jgi:CheY-like chemotaxis protein
MPHRARVVLLVEPNPNLSSVMASSLRSAGHSVLVASSADEAVAFCGEISDVGLLIAELCLPGMGAIELAQRVSTLVPGVKFLFLATSAEESLLRQAIGNRGKVLPKPIALSDLVDDVNQLLGGK